MLVEWVFCLCGLCLFVALVGVGLGWVGVFLSHWLFTSNFVKGKNRLTDFQGGRLFIDITFGNDFV